MKDGKFRQTIVRYDLSYLLSYCEKNNVELLGKYNKVVRDTRINGICNNVNCKEVFSKVFRQIIKAGAYCTTCSKIIKWERFRQSCLNNLGENHPLKVKEIKDKAKQTFSKNYKEQPLKLQELIKRREETCMKNLGVNQPFKLKEVRDRAKQTWLKNLGVDNPLKSESVKEKSKQTCLKKLGVPYPSQSESVKEKSKQTCLKNLGVPYPGQSESVKEKAKQTNLKNLGVPYPGQSESVKEKMRKTYFERYQVYHPMHNREIAERCAKRAFKFKDYTFPSGNIRKYQGYENFALDELLKQGYLEEDLVTEFKNVPIIKYRKDDNDGTKIGYHYVDIYIKSENRCVEVKSTWTLELNKEIVFLKQKGAKLNGMKYEIWVYNQKGKIVQKFE
jgi:hypothetical protein